MERRAPRPCHGAPRIHKVNQSFSTDLPPRDWAFGNCHGLPCLQSGGELASHKNSKQDRPRLANCSRMQCKQLVSTHRCRIRDANGAKLNNPPVKQKPADPHSPGAIGAHDSLPTAAGCCWRLCSPTFCSVSSSRSVWFSLRSASFSSLYVLSFAVKVLIFSKSVLQAVESLVIWALSSRRPLLTI